MKIFAALLVLCAPALLAQTNTPAPAETDPLKPLSFLEGSWETKTQGGSAGAQVTGAYTFQLELRNHILARHTKNISGCKGPETFDCEHSDLFYIFEDATSHTLKAIYFDNEGHVIHYDVSTPGQTTAVFLSDEHNPGPQYRLVYELKDAVMQGKFQIRMPGQKEWRSYLEWSGPKQM